MRDSEAHIRLLVPSKSNRNIYIFYNGEFFDIRYPLLEQISGSVDLLEVAPMVNRTHWIHRG
jgi:hypothetical protein